MNRIIEIVAMTVGGASLFVVCFVAFVSLSGTNMSDVAVIGKLFPAPPEAPPDEHGAAVEGGEAIEASETSLSDAAVVEASLGVLSAWTLPSPYSTSELRVLSEEIKRKHAELQDREQGLARRERAVAEDEHELEDRLGTLEELRTHLESLQMELGERELELTRAEDSARAGSETRWTELAGVIGAIEEASAAAQRLQEYPPEEAAKVLRALGDDTRAGEILNEVPAPRWKEFVDAYTAEKARAGGKKRSARP